MHTSIELLVGLGNPGPRYSDTRHNAGAWLVELLAKQHSCELRQETKFQGRFGTIQFNNHECRLFIPSTFMNLSGQAVQSVANFYKIAPEAILVAHDDLDLPPGDIRLKSGGGHGGHNGLRDIINHVNSNQFHRLRIGIGHPGTGQDVANFVLTRPSLAEQQQIDEAIATALTVLPIAVAGQMQKAMNQLHAPKEQK